MVDTHAHLNFEAFNKDYAQVIERSLASGVKTIINVGSKLATSQKAVKISGEYKKGIYAAVGLHPIHVTDEEFKVKEFGQLAKNPKVVAIGETGLDYYHYQQSKDLQKEIFIKHLQLAKGINLPVILHCRGSKENPKDAYLEMLEIIKDKNFSGVIHCFSADWPIAQKFLQLGLYIGFTGPITFKNATPELLEVVKKAPIDKILTETDCPFLAPEPFRGQRNEPAYVEYITRKIVEIRNLSFDPSPLAKGEGFEKIDKITTANAKKLFCLS
jgi:TatD DNase family protein